MPNARLATLLTVAVASVLSLFLVSQPALTAGLLQASKMSYSMSSGLATDGAARLGLALLLFGIVFGIGAGLSNLLIGARPLVDLATHLAARPHEVGSSQREFLLDALSTADNLREPLAKLRLQLTARPNTLAADSDPATLPVPAHQMIAPSALLRGCFDLWFMRAVTLLLLACGVVLLAWGLASGADSQALNVSNMSYGHPSGVLLGLRSGSFALLCSLVGAASVYFLGVGSYAYAASRADQLVARINSLTLLAPTADAGDAGALNLVTVQPEGPSMVDLNTLLTDTENRIAQNFAANQTELNARLQELLVGLTRQIAQTQSQLTAGLKQLKPADPQPGAEQLDRLIAQVSTLADQSHQNVPLLGGIAEALTDVRAALSDMQDRSRVQPMRSSGFPGLIDGDAARRLSTAIRALRDASDVSAA